MMMKPTSWAMIASVLLIATFSLFVAGCAGPSTSDPVDPQTVKGDIEADTTSPQVPDDQVADATTPEDKPVDKKDEKPVDTKPTDNKTAIKLTGDWNQWGGSPLRNNTPEATNIPIDWDVGKFDRKTGKWLSETAQNVSWIANLGSQTYGNPVVFKGRIYVGTNNGAGHVKRYPYTVDLGCVLCFNEADGKFLWQHSNEKLPTGRVHDWEQQGVCSTVYAEGERIWYVSNRGHVVCLDTEGYYDDEDDGPVKGELGRLFDLRAGIEPVVAALDKGSLDETLKTKAAAAGMEITGEVKVETVAAGKKWKATTEVAGSSRELQITLAGPKLSVFKVITTDDKEEADVIWSFNMMDELSVSQHNMCACSVTAVGDILYVNTSNGQDESHKNIPYATAPSFIAMDKNTGEVFWTDKSPGLNILHGQWSSPSVAELGGVPQVIFAGGDGWVYSFKADKGKDGKPELLWKLDANPKTSMWELGGRGTRNNIIATPVIYNGLVYVAVGQDPEHGEGIGHLWCIDPTKRGDVSPELAVNVSDRTKTIPHKRLQAVIETDGEVAIDNPNSAVVWHYSTFDQDGDGKISYEETMHRSCGTVAIKNDLLYISDFSGLLHCLDAKNGKVHWTYDMLAQAWGSPLIVEDKVYIGDEDGDVCIFKLSAEPQEDPIAELSMGSSVYSTPIVANGVLYITSKDKLFAIKEAK